VRAPHLAVFPSAAALAALLLTAGCALFFPGDDTDREVPRACTEEFRTYTVQVVDTQGQPVEGLTSTARLARTGEVLAEDQAPFPPGEGYHLVATDADRSRFRPEEDTVRFVAEGAGLRAEAVFTFYDDGCHLAKRSGPERVVAAPAGG
jgi:hypothetical protein